MKHKKPLILLFSLAFLTSCSTPVTYKNVGFEKNEFNKPATSLEDEEELPSSENNNSELENPSSDSEDNNTNSDDKTDVSEDDNLDEKPTQEVPIWTVLDELPFETLYSFAKAETSKEVETLSLRDVSTNFNFTDSNVTILEGESYPSQLAYYSEENEDGEKSFTLFNYLTAQRINYFPSSLGLQSLPISVVDGLPLAYTSINGVTEFFDLAGNYLAHYLVSPQLNIVKQDQDSTIINIKDNNGFNSYFETAKKNNMTTFKEVLYSGNSFVKPNIKKTPLYEKHVNSLYSYYFDNRKNQINFYDLGENLVKSIALDDLIKNKDKLYGEVKYFATDSAIYFFVSEKETLPKQSEYDTAKDIYSSYAYALNLNDFTLSYTDDLNYIILDQKSKYQIIDENHYVSVGSVLKVQFFDKNGELTDFNYLIDISNSLTPTSVIRLDNFFNFDDYIVINGELIVKDNYQYYIIKEDRHTEYLKDVYSIEYYDDNEVIYQDYDGNYKNVGAEDFVNQKFSKAFDSISTTFTNDTHISYNVDFSNDIVYLNDDSVADIKYLNYAKEGFIVKENQENKTFSVKLFNNPTVYEYDSDKIVGINKFTSTDNSTLYQVQYELSNHDYSLYFVLKRSEN